MLFIVRRNSQLLGATTTVVEPGRKWPLPSKYNLVAPSGHDRSAPEADL